MLYLDLFFRFSAITLLAIQTIMLLRDARDVRPARFGAALTFSLIFLFLVEGPTDLGLSTTVITLMAGLFTMNITIFQRWFVLSLFEDNFRLGRFELGLFAVYAMLGIPFLIDFNAGDPSTFGLAGVARTAIAIGVTAHIFYSAIAGHQGDLIEARRRARVWFVIAIAAIQSMIIIGELVFRYGSEPTEMLVLKHGAIFAVIVWGTLWLTRLDKSALSFEKRAPTAAPEPTLNPKEQLIFNRLQELIESEKIYLEPGLTIGALAQKLKAPEHQLRALINKALGYRNFAAYLNSYRIEAAKTALSDPEKAPLPVLTIAMDVGYGSLAPFNRAFRSVVGKTPTDFRREALSNSAASPSGDKQESPDGLDS